MDDGSILGVKADDGLILDFILGVRVDDDATDDESAILDDNSRLDIECEIMDDDEYVLLDEEEYTSLDDEDVFIDADEYASFDEENCKDIIEELENVVVA